MEQKIRKTVLSALFLAIGLLLPFFTGQIPQIGKMLLPMHIPVLLCGLICGWEWGLIVGILTPLCRSMIFGMPVLFPTAVAMAFELATYGGMVGFMYNHSKWQCIRSLYRSMITAMLSGRVIWGMVMVVIMGMTGGTFTLQVFMAGALLNAIPGIVLQLILIPAMMVILDRTKLVPFTKRQKNMGLQVKNGQ